MATLPISGTTRPALSVPNLLDETPTSQGINPPPRLESVNMTDPIRDAAGPNSRDKSEIVIG